MCVGVVNDRNSLNLLSIGPNPSQIIFFQTFHRGMFYIFEALEPFYGLNFIEWNINMKGLKVSWCKHRRDLHGVVMKRTYKTNMNFVNTGHLNQ